MSAAHGTGGLVERGGIPLHHQLSSVLRAAIRSGRYAPGDVLPGEHELSRAYAVSRATVRRALQTLEQDQLVDRRPGVGTIVQPFRAALVTGSINEHLSVVERYAERTQISVQALDDVWPSRAAARALRLADGALVRRIVRVRRRGKIALRYMVTEVPHPAGREITRSQLTRGTVVEGLRRLGMPVHRTEDEIGATLADAVVAAALDVRIGDPLLEVARTMFDAAGTPIAYQWTVASPQVWRMLITFDGDGR